MLAPSRLEDRSNEDARRRNGAGLRSVSTGLNTSPDATASVLLTIHTILPPTTDRVTHTAGWCAERRITSARPNRFAGLTWFVFLRRSRSRSPDARTFDFPSAAARNAVLQPRRLSGHVRRRHGDDGKMHLVLRLLICGQDVPGPSVRSRDVSRLCRLPGHRGWHGSLRTSTTVSSTSRSTRVNYPVATTPPITAVTAQLELTRSWSSRCSRSSGQRH